MEEKLWAIFRTVNTWLEFAEKKNAYLLTFVGLQFTLIKACSLPTNFWLIGCIITLLLSLLLCILSFFPVTGMAEYIYKLTARQKKPEDTDNLLFYNHIAKYSADEYVAAMEKYLKGAIKNDKYLTDLCLQIVANSTITDEKFELFKLNFWLLVIAEIFFAISFLK